MSEIKNINDVIKQTSLSFVGLSEKDKAEKRGDMIIYALRNRTFLIFPKEKRLIACAPDGIVEFGKADYQNLVKAVDAIDKSFDEIIKKNGIKDPERIYSYLETSSEIDSAYIGEIYPEMDKRAEKIIRRIGELYKGAKTPEEKAVLEEGITKFYYESKMKIPENNFKTGDYRISPREEKLSVRNDFIASMMLVGAGDFELFNKLGYFRDLSQEDIFMLADAKVITANELRIAIQEKFNYKTPDEYFEFLNKCKRINKDYLSAFSTEELIGFALDGKLDKKVFTRMKFAPHYIAKLPLEKLFKMVNNASIASHVGMTTTKNENGKTVVYLKKDFIKTIHGIKLVELIKETGFKPDMTKEELFDQYLDTLSGRDVINLAKMGYIDDKDVIRLNFIRTGNPYKDNLMVDDILGFYDIERLQKMVGDKKLSKRFVEDYNDTLTMLDPKKLNGYVSRLMISPMERLPKDEIMAALSIAGCFDDVDLNGYTIGASNLEQLYMLDRVTEEDMFTLAAKGVVSMATLGKLVSDAEITQNIIEGKLPLEAFKATKQNEEVLLELLASDKVSPRELGHFYSTNENMSAETFLTYLELIDEAREIDVSDLLDDDISKEKVQDLFSKFYISQDELSNLVGRKIISQAEADSYAKELEKHNNFNSLFKKDSPSIKLVKRSESLGRRELTGEGDGQSNSRKGNKIDFDLKEKLLFEMGASHNVLELIGKNNSLDGYRVYGFEKTGAMVFMSPEPDNATYVMSLAQGLYFIKNFERENGEGASQVISTATKRALRNTEHIDVRNASKKWGRNMIRSIDRKGGDLSTKSKEYRAKLDSICKEIEEDYMSRL
ncbi:MAG: hypothetical protein IKN74_00210 [Clostridia bacterium]|nr:hypothetical protein [Clostridia bacterium]